MLSSVVKQPESTSPTPRGLSNNPVVEMRTPSAKAEKPKSDAPAKNFGFFRRAVLNSVYEVREHHNANYAKDNFVQHRSELPRHNLSDRARLGLPTSYSESVILSKEMKPSTAIQTLYDYAAYLMNNGIAYQYKTQQSQETQDFLMQFYNELPQAHSFKHIVDEQKRLCSLTISQNYLHALFIMKVALDHVHPHQIWQYFLNFPSGDTATLTLLNGSVFTHNAGGANALKDILFLYILQNQDRFISIDGFSAGLNRQMQIKGDESGLPCRLNNRKIDLCYIQFMNGAIFQDQGVIRYRRINRLDREELFDKDIPVALALLTNNLQIPQRQASKCLLM